MIRKDLGDNIMEVCHTDGTDRWLVIKKELDASNVRNLLMNCFAFFVFCNAVIVFQTFDCLRRFLVVSLDKRRCSNDGVGFSFPVVQRLKPR